jgi:hypothetical protein
MVDIWPVLNEIHREMLPVHEEWVGGMKLQPTNIYGIRVNRNGSALALHYDKVSLQAARCCVVSYMVYSCQPGEALVVAGVTGITIFSMRCRVIFTSHSGHVAICTSVPTFCDCR